MKANKECGIILRKIRMDLNLSMHSIAKLVGCTEQLWSAMEAGKRNVSFKRAYAIRTLAFSVNLPYAPYVFPETDNFLRRPCPLCKKDGFVPYIPKSMEWNADYFIKTFCENNDE